MNPLTPYTRNAHEQKAHGPIGPNQRRDTFAFLSFSFLPSRDIRNNTSSPVSNVPIPLPMSAIPPLQIRHPERIRHRKLLRVHRMSHKIHHRLIRWHIARAGEYTQHSRSLDNCFTVLPHAFP